MTGIRQLKKDARALERHAEDQRLIANYRESSQSWGAASKIWNEISVKYDARSRFFWKVSAFSFLIAVLSVVLEWIT